MRLVRRLRCVWIVLAAVAAAGCGSDGPGVTEPVRPEPNFVQLQSDAGDFIGLGRSYRYTQEDAVLDVTASGGRLSIAIEGDEEWSGEFQLPGSPARLQPGTYANVQRYPVQDPAAGGLDWSGEGRGCSRVVGSFTIDSLTYTGTRLTAIDLGFEQRCEAGATALRGRIHWRADDPTTPPGPVMPVPASLWKPAPGSTPATGSYVHLASDPGDFVGGGQVRTFSGAAINVRVNGNRLSISGGGEGNWSGEFQAMSSLAQLQPGLYDKLQRYPFHNPARGGLAWSGDSRGCNRLTGWFALDRITYTSGVLTAVDLRFEQHCEGAGPALRGAIHWVR